jgi:phosphate transport system permease protein
MSQGGTEVVPQREPGTEKDFKTSTGARHTLDGIFTAIIFVATVIGLVVLAVLLIDIARQGLPALNWGFLTGLGSAEAEDAGLLPPLVGSVMLLAIVVVVAVPLGIGAAVYLEEYASDNWLNRIVEINISNLAGVPSIIYGLLGLGIFVYVLGFGKSILSGGLVLSLLVLPIIIIATREAVRAVPNAVREGAYALGATQWETIRHHVLPMALPGALTGTILALSRALGETAPLIAIGAVPYLTFVPTGLGSAVTAIPVQIYNWVSQPDDEFQAVAAAGIVVLMVVLLAANAGAILLRNRFQRRN